MLGRHQSGILQRLCFEGEGSTANFIEGSEWPLKFGKKKATPREVAFLIVAVQLPCSSTSLPRQSGIPPLENLRGFLIRIHSSLQIVLMVL